MLSIARLPFVHPWRRSKYTPRSTGGSSSSTTTSTTVVRSQLSLVSFPWSHSRASRTTGSIIHSYEIETYTKSTRSAFAESVSKTAIATLTKAGTNVETGGSYGPVSARVQKSFGQKHSLEDMLQKTTRESGEDVCQVTTRVKRECEFSLPSPLCVFYDRRANGGNPSADTVGPKSKLSLYQQCLDGPGLRAAFEVFSTEPSRANQKEDVVIDVVAKPLDFVQSLEASPFRYIHITSILFADSRLPQVVYTDDPSNAPRDRLREVRGYNADINAGFGGKYVLLRSSSHPSSTFTPCHAITV